MQPTGAFFALCLAVSAVSCDAGRGGEALPDAVALRDTIIAQFSRSADAWTRGDLDAFMADYAEDSLTGYVTRCDPRQPAVREFRSPSAGAQGGAGDGAIRSLQRRQHHGERSLLTGDGAAPGWMEDPA
jgi:hypothetical protein